MPNFCLPKSGSHYHFWAVLGPVGIVFNFPLMLTIVQIWLLEYLGHKTFLMDFTLSISLKFSTVKSLEFTFSTSVIRVINDLAFKFAPCCFRYAIITSHGDFICYYQTVPMWPHERGLFSHVTQSVSSIILQEKGYFFLDPF